MEIQVQQIKTGDIMLNAYQGEFLHHTFTGSLTNHAGLFVWIEAPEARYGDEKVHEQFRLEYGPGRKLFIFHVIGTDMYQLIPYDKNFKKSMRVVHRGVEYSDGEAHLEKFKKFYLKSNTVHVKFKLRQMLSAWIPPIPADREGTFEMETCVGFVMTWLFMLGYNMKDPGVPIRNRQLMTTDHLLSAFNKSPLLSPRENILVNNVKIMSPITYVITICTLILLLIMMLFAAKSPLVLLAMAVPGFLVIRSLKMN